MNKKRIGRVLLAVSLTACLTMGSAMPVSAASKVSKPAKVASVTLKSKVAGKVTVSWKKVKKVKGYQVTLSTAKRFKAGTKTYTVAASKRVKTISGLKQGKKYYAKVRAYTVSKGKKVYGKWSTVKAATVKRTAKKPVQPITKPTEPTNPSTEPTEPSTGGNEENTGGNVETKDPSQSTTEPTNPSEENKTPTTGGDVNEDGTQDDPCCHSHHYVYQNLSNTTAPKQKTVKEKKVMTEGKWHEEWKESYVQCNNPLPGCSTSDPVDSEHRCCWTGVVKWQSYDSDGYGSNIPQFSALVKHLKEEHYELYKTNVLNAMDVKMSNMGLGEEFDSMSWDEIEDSFWNSNSDLVTTVGASVAHEFWSSTKKVWDEEPQVISYFPEKTISIETGHRTADKVCTKCGKTVTGVKNVAYDGSHEHDFVKFKDMDLTDADKYYIEEVSKTYGVDRMCRTCGVWF